MKRKDSLLVARVFEKKHTNVLRDIRNLECSYEFRELNFHKKLRNFEMYNGAFHNKPYYEMTLAGLLFLVTGFAGKRTAKFKELYFTEGFEMAWNWICEESINKTVKSDQLYVVLYQDGMIKVGKGMRAKSRIENHKQFAKSHSNPITAWHIESTPKITEKELIEFCKLHGTLHSGKEYFKNLNYVSVINFLKPKIERKQLSLVRFNNI